MDAVLFAWPEGDVGFWRQEMEAVLGPLDFRVYPHAGNRDDIGYALVWRHPPGDLATYPHLKAIFSLGAGVPYVLSDPDLPDVPVVRFAHDELSRDVTQYAVHWLLHFHRDFHRYRAQQTAGDWTRHVYAPNQSRRVTVLGLGRIGEITARACAGMGFDVTGWSRRPKTITGVRCLAGTGELPAALRDAEFLISVLPATGALADLLDYARLKHLARGAFVINVGRGETVVDGDLLRLLNEGRLAGAALDVFRTEPLPADDPLWSHPRVFVTPHTAGPSTNAWAPSLVADNIARMRRGEPPFPIVDVARGY